MRDSFIFYKSFIQAIEDQPADDFKKIIMAAAAYALDGIEPELNDSAVKMAFSFMKPLLDSNNERWEETCKKRAESGRKGGLAKAANVANLANARSPKKPVANLANARSAKANALANVANLANLANLADNDNDNVNDNVDVDVANQTTTNILHIQETAKAQGFFISDKQAQKFQCLDPAWLSGDYNFLVFAAEKVRDNSEKDRGDQERIFAMSWSYENLVHEFPKWREERIAEAETLEKKRRQAAANDAERRRIDQARTDKPEVCAHCGGALAVSGERGTCEACGWFYSFNEESGQWEFYESFSFGAVLENLKRQSEEGQPAAPDLNPRFKLRYDYLFNKNLQDGMTAEQAENKAMEAINEYIEMMGDDTALNNQEGIK